MSRSFLRKLALAGAFGVTSCLLHAQDEEGMTTEKPDTARFQIGTAFHKVPYSLYRTIELIDQRPDTINLGLITTTTAYDLTVVPLRPLADQFAALVTGLTDSTAAAGVLLLQLRQFMIYDIQTSFRHACGTSLRAVLFAHSDSGYRKLAVLDTTIEQPFTSLFNGSLRKRLLTATSATLEKFVADALLRKPAANSAPYSMDEVISIDSVERCRLPLYTARGLTDGVYLCFNSFLQLKPDYRRYIASETDDQITDVLVQTATEPSARLGPQQVFAFVQKGYAYISTKEGYKPLTKKGNDFFYTGKISVSADNASNLANFASWAVTVATLGRLRVFDVWRLTTKKDFLMRMDYTNGKFVPVRQAN